MVRTRIARFCTAVTCVIVAFTTSASGQCGGWVHDLESYGPEFLRSMSPRVIDRDGADGPQIPRIVGLGVDRLVMKSDQDWAFLSERLTGEVYPLEAWDADGPGPMTPRLYFGRGASGSDGPFLDSVPWPKTGAVGSHALAPVPGRVYDMRLTDPDGPGPARARPIVACAGTPAGTTIVVLEWGGTAWIQRGSTLVGNDATLIVSPSSSGGGDEWIIYGNFHRPGPPFVNIIARYDGSNWVALGAGLQSGGVSGAALWDHDGDPSSPRRLVVSGSFTGSGTTPLERVAMFDGTNWISLGDDLTGTAHAIATYLHVTTRREEMLVTTSGVGGSDAKFLAFDGHSWRNTDHVGDFIASWAAPQTWDPDGPLSDPPAALALITNGYALPRVEPGLFIWDGEEWRAVVQSPWVSDSVQSSWDRDGEGPARPVIAHVRVREVEAGRPREVVLWDGVSWQTHSLGFEAEYIHALISWDPDGLGPLAPLLVIGGAFTIAIPGSPDIQNVVGWNGDSLVPLGEGLKSDSVYTGVQGAVSWDPDGLGPEVAMLFAFGLISGSGTDSFESIAMFNGEQWQQLGQGIAPKPGHGRDCVYQLAPWDPDGNGPLQSLLLIGGEFSIVPTTTVVGLAAWNGGSIQPLSLPHGMEATDRIISWSDDSAAVGARLLIGHDIWSESSDDPSTGYWWSESIWTSFVKEGTGWTPFKHYFNEWQFDGHDVTEYGAPPPSVMVAHDPDGTGPLSSRLVFGRDGHEVDGFNVGSDGFPDATAFQGGPIAYEYYGTPHFEDYTVMRSLISHRLVPSLEIASYSGEFYELVVSNSYTDTVNPPRPIDGIARWMEGPPRILEVPEPRTNPETRAFGLTVHAIGGGDLGYQWTRNGEVLKGGVTSRGSVVHSPAGPTLMISNASHLDQGEYQCRVINSCGSTLSPALTMPFIHCASDVNFDDTVDILDMLDFLQAYGECEGLPAPCGDTANPDFNGDGEVDVSDFLEFFDRFGQEC